MNNIREGEDIYLECLVDSRPPVTKLYYTHKVGDSVSNFFQRNNFEYRHFCTDKSQSISLSSNLNATSHIDTTDF